jgi:predicted regulator of Ras-like GTPase activity (Roadblock/LC7/MglB family)
MEDNVRSDALMSTLNEITNVCPDIKSIFIFKADGTITGEERTREQIASPTVDALGDLLEKAETLGGVQNIIVEGAKGTVNVVRVNDSYVVTATGEGADPKYANTLATALIRTALNLLERINSALNRDNLPGPKESMIKPDIRPIEETVPENPENHEEKARRIATGPEKTLPEPQVNQLIVDKTEGLFASSDTVRIDGATISQWAELYEKEKIQEVTIETFGGKSAVCKLKPIKGSKHEGQGLVQIPEKIQKSLEVKKGELVRVKPIIE